MMQMAAAAPGKRPLPWGTWLLTFAAGLTALICGAGLVAPVCYWQGRMLVRGTEPGLTPMAWRAADGPAYALLLALAAVWAALWLMHAMRVRRLRLSLLHAAIPMAVFLWAAWQASRMAYACNIM